MTDQPVGTGFDGDQLVILVDASHHQDDEAERPTPIKGPTRTKGPTQAERIYKALKNAGRRGVTCVDFEDNPVIDGGPKIRRTARCIHDLKEQGVSIFTDRSGPGGCAHYWLTEYAPSAHAESRAA